MFAVKRATHPAARPQNWNTAERVINNLNFSYNEDLEVLKQLNLSVNSGQIVALVGASGAGKSTIFSLLLKFIKPNSGLILYDNKNINEINTYSLRRQIAIVPQKTFIFSGTISESIRFGRNASEDDVIKAAKIANAHDFIKSLPNGYKTYIEERGANLSGGQLQRISIARAILGNPTILLLDEATSSLDAEAENQYKRVLNKLCKIGQL